jgi:hypothetical protein
MPDDVGAAALHHVHEPFHHQCIMCSKGLRQLLNAPENSDEEIAAEEIGRDVITLIEAETWRKITRIPTLARYGLGTAPDP